MRHALAPRGVPMLMLAVASASSAAAQDYPAVHLDTIEVRRGLTREGGLRVEHYRLTEPVPTVTVDRKDLELLPSDRVSDALARMPGVQVSGPPGEKKAFGLRGLTPDYTRVSIDGVQVPSSAGGRSFELMNVPTFLLEEASIIRNPGAENEADGIGGRISLRTRRMPTGNHLEIRGGSGGVDKIIDGRHGQFSVAGSRLFDSGFGVLGAINVDQRRISKIKDFSEFNYFGGPGGRGTIIDQREVKDIGNIDMMGQMGWGWKGGSFVAKSLYFNETVFLPNNRRYVYRRLTRELNGRELTRSTETSTLSHNALSFEQHFSPLLFLQLDASYSLANYDSRVRGRSVSNQLIATGGYLEKSKIEDKQYDLSAKATTLYQLGGEHELKYGVSLRRLERNSDRNIDSTTATGQISRTQSNIISSSESDYAVGETLMAGFVQNRVRIGRLDLTPGLRYEQIENDLRGNGIAARREGQDLLPSFHTSYLLTDAVRLNAGVSRQLNRPQLQEIAPGITRRGQRLYEGDPNLKPARAWSYDAGLAYVTPYAFLGVNLFHREIDDVIESVEITRDRFRTRNVGNGRVRGVELEQRLNAALLGYAWLAPLTLTANQTFLDSKVYDPATGPRRFSETARFVSNWGVLWVDEATGLQLASSLSWITPRTILSYQGSGSLLYKKLRTNYFWDARIEKAIDANMSFYASVENILGQARDEFEAVPAGISRVARIETGRTFMIGTRGRF